MSDTRKGPEYSIEQIAKNPKLAWELDDGYICGDGECLMPAALEEEDFKEALEHLISLPELAAKPFAVKMTSKACIIAHAAMMGWESPYAFVPSYKDNYKTF